MKVARCLLDVSSSLHRTLLPSLRLLATLAASSLTTTWCEADKCSMLTTAVLPAATKFQYWQLDHDPGQHLTAAYWTAANRTQRNQVLCKLAFGTSECPLPQLQPAPSEQIRNRGTTSSPPLLFFTTFGRLTNCLMVAELARWLAEQLNKTLVMPLCSSAENTEQACTSGSRRKDHLEDNLLVNDAAVYERSSLGGCTTQRPALDLFDPTRSHRRTRQLLAAACVHRQRRG